MGNALNAMLSDASEDLNPYLQSEDSKNLLAYVQSELDSNQYTDFESEFLPQINSIFHAQLEMLSNYQSFKSDQIYVAKKMLLKSATEDIMSDYQRLTPSESQKFDNKFGDLIDKANRANYSEIPGSNDPEDRVNFRDVDVDKLFELNSDLFLYLEDRDSNFFRKMRIGQ